MIIMGVLYKLLLVVVPVLLLMWYMYRICNGGNVPAKWLKMAFWGGFLLVPSVFCIIPFLDATNIYDENSLTVWGELWNMFVSGALLEELLKFILLCLIVNFFRFKKGTDLVVVAAFIGLGFACAENILYILLSDDWVGTGVARALRSLPDHCCYAIIMGYFYYWARCIKGRMKYLFYVLAFFLPVACHWGSNALLMVDNFNVFLPIILTVAVIVLSKWLINLLKSQQGGVVQ